MTLPFLSLEPAWGRHLGWVPFFVIAPLAWVLLCAPLPEAGWSRALYSFFLGWIAGVIFFLTTLFWISSVAWEGVALLPPFLALYFGVWALFVTTVVRPIFLKTDFHAEVNWCSSLGAVLVSSAAWVGVEWVRGTLFTGFGWNAFGVSFYQNLPLIQFADITGVAGLSFLAVMTGCMTALAIERSRSAKNKRLLSKSIRNSSMTMEEKAGENQASSDYKKNSQLQDHRGGSVLHHHTRMLNGLYPDVALVFILVLAAFFYGVFEITHPLPQQEPLSVAAVQGNIPQNHKWNCAFEEEIMNIYEKETRLALKAHPDLVVWPEAATPRPLLNDQKTFSQVTQLVQEGNIDLLAGSLYYEENPSRDYNAAILLSPSPKSPQVYAKIHLVPFGEYIPLRKTFPLFEWVVGDRVLGDFNAGPGPKVLQLTKKPIKIAPLICFEDTLGELVRHFAGLGAQFLITLTNDGWFGHTVASKQHAMNALFRSVETKLPLLRVANTGVTCVIDCYGRVTEVLRDPHGSTFFEGILLSQLSVPCDPKPTFYTRYGDWFSYLGLGVIIVGIVWCAICRAKKFFR